jgi:hypothetical protein
MECPIWMLFYKKDFFCRQEKKMLKPTYTPLPGNPNVKVRTDNSNNDEDESKDTNEQKKIKSEPKESDVKKKLKFDKEPGPMDDIYQRATVLFYQALQPLYQVVGIIENVSGSKIYYRYAPQGTPDMERQTPLNRGAKNEAQFRAMNGHLGNAILDALFPPPQKIGFDISHLTDAQRTAYADLLVRPGHFLSLGNVPSWIWYMLPDAALMFLLNSATYGALTMAANELKYPLKDLIYSSDVNHLFGKFVAHKFFQPPMGNAQSAQIDRGTGRMQYRISTGFSTTQAANTKWIMGCKELFATKLHYTQNPEAPTLTPYQDLLQRRKETFDAVVGRVPGWTMPMIVRDEHLFRIIAEPLTDAATVTSIIHVAKRYREAQDIFDLAKSFQRRLSIK